jgi:hypothetical protein
MPSWWWDLVDFYLLRFYFYCIQKQGLAMFHRLTPHSWVQGILLPYSAFQVAGTSLLLLDFSIINVLIIV